ncbi:MAG: hypothetical protein HY902_20700 [Deltaproteobacteria bacterium]|nr:hypothetical protein [Deltaproteobacteria bacterium]
MNTRNATLAAALLLAAVASGIGIGRAVATGAPTQAPLTYAGTLTDQDGKPYASAQDVTLKLYDAASGGTQKCATGTVQAEANTGNFQVTLPADCVQAVRDQSELWTELTVGAGKTVLPRTKLGAVPYALEADTAKVAGSAAAASGALKTQVEGIQAKVDGLAAGGGSGGPWLVDANGVKLGHASPTSATMFYVTTSKARTILVALDGKVHNSSAIPIYYSQPNCAGSAFVTVDGAGSYVQSGAQAYYSTAAGTWFAPKAAPNGSWNPSDVPCASYLDPQKVGPTACTNTPNLPTFTVRPVALLAAVDVGVPDQIVGPLTYVP